MAGMLNVKLEKEGEIEREKKGTAGRLTTIYSWLPSTWKREQGIGRKKGKAKGDRSEMRKLNGG